MKVLMISILAIATSVAFAGNTATCPTKAKASTEAACCAAEAKTMAKSSAKSEACCTSKASKPVAKAGKGCCNAAGEYAKYKIFVDGQYMYYGCEESAGKARTQMVAVAFNVGKIQTVSGKVMIPKNQKLAAMVR